MNSAMANMYINTMRYKISFMYHSVTRWIKGCLVGYCPGAQSQDFVHARKVPSLLYLSSSGLKF
jgi:hypothetical protein